jgi:hypothetical protein
MVQQGMVNESTVALDICTLSTDLADMCTRLKNAHTLVVSGNCLAAEGDDCQPQEWVYSPSMYSNSNQEFVRSTVINYYETYGAAESVVFTNENLPNEELVCPLDDEDQLIRIRNDQLSISCASRQLEHLKEAMQIARRVVHLLVEMAYIAMQIAVTIFRFMLPGADISAITKELEFWFIRLMTMLADSITAIANLMFRMVTDSPGLGQAMKELINLLCATVQVLYDIYNITVCPILTNIVRPIIIKLKELISSFPGHDPSIVTDLEKIQRTLDLSCNEQFPCIQVETEVSAQELGVLPVTSRCWADYTPGVDDLSSFSCASSDTCTNADLSFGQTNLDFGGIADSGRQVLCNSCPRTSNPDINRFGCDTYTKQCSCSRPKTTVTSCTSNEECQMQGLETQCALVSDFTTGKGYGTLGCQTCTQAVCLISDGAKQVGKCSCLQQGLRLQQCQQSEVFLSLITDATALCAVTTSKNSMRTVNPFLTWRSLATAPCAIINKANTQCYRTDVMGYVVVGHGTVDTRFLGRRLLQEEDTADWDLDMEILDFDSWNHTAQPCRMLAETYIRNISLSVTEEAHLDSCVRARQLGSHTINTLNLTHLQDYDHFLMSFTDFVSVASRRGVLRQLLSTNGLTRFVVTQSSFFKPWLSACRRLIEAGVVMFVDRPEYSQRNITNNWSPNRTNFTDQGWYAELVSAQTMATHLIDPFATRDMDIQLLEEKIHLPDKKIISSIIFDLATKITQEMEPTEPSKSNRRLLQDDAVFRFSALTAATKGWSNIPLANSMADNWLEGPFGWPPKIDDQYWSDSESCTAAQITLGVLSDSGAVLNSFFRGYKNSTDQLTWGVMENIPTTYTGTMPQGIVFNTTLPALAPAQPRVVNGSDWPSTFFVFMGETVLQNYFGWSTDAIVDFFTTKPDIPRDVLTARNIVKDMLMCDFESVMLCSRHNRRIFVSLVISYIFYLIVAVLAGLAGFPGIADMVFYTIPFITLWLSYGLSPVCLPMIPTCILSDIIESVQIAMPAKITWPDTLQIYPGCIGPKWYDPNATIVTPPQFANVTRGSSSCMKSCKVSFLFSPQTTMHVYSRLFIFQGPPFYFTSWESSLAWVACTLNATSCTSLQIPYFPNVSEQVQQYSQVLLAAQNTADIASVDRTAAYTFCFWMTIAQAVPYVILGLGLLLLAITLVQLPTMIASTAIQCIVQAVVYTHVDN